MTATTDFGIASDPTVCHCASSSAASSTTASASRAPSTSPATDVATHRQLALRNRSRSLSSIVNGSANSSAKWPARNRAPAYTAARPGQSHAEFVAAGGRVDRVDADVDLGVRTQPPHHRRHLPRQIGVDELVGGGDRIRRLAERRRQQRLAQDRERLRRGHCRPRPARRAARTSSSRSVRVAPHVERVDERTERHHFGVGVVGIGRCLGRGLQSLDAVVAARDCPADASARRAAASPDGDGRRRERGEPTGAGRPGWPHRAPPARRAAPARRAHRR